MSSKITPEMLKGAETEAKYPSITYGEYRVWWLNNNYRAKLTEA